MIRAFRMERHFRSLIHFRAGENLKALFYLNSADRWLALLLEWIGAFVVLFCTLFTILEEGTSAGTAGLTISYAINVTQVKTWRLKGGLSQRSFIHSYIH